MSGLEALGVAASIIQVADLGTKLSVKLFSFYRRVKNANDSIQLLSNEIALVSAILRELGDNLKAEESSKLCSDEAFRTLGLVLNQCRDVLGQIQRVVDHNDQPGKGRFQQVTGKFRIVLLEPSLDQLKITLERLKSTMLLLLNVILYAGQIRRYACLFLHFMIPYLYFISNHIPTLVQEQRDLLQNLLESQTETPKTRQSDTGVEFSRGLSTETTRSRSSHASTDETSDEKYNSKTPQPLLKNQSLRDSMDHANSSEGQIGAHRATEGNTSPELKEYNVLMQSMLDEIELCKSKLEKNRHSRIKNGVLNIHSGEITRFQIEHGPSIHIDHSLFAVLQPNVTSRSPSLAGLYHSSQSTKMPVDHYLDPDESDFSETDLSIRGRKDRTPIHRRSVSRQHPETKETSLMSVQPPSRMSHSPPMGRRRSFERTRPARFIVNEQGQRTGNGSKPPRVPRKVYDDSDEEVVRLLQWSVASSLSHESSPSPRDPEIATDQRMLERSDYRKDMEIWKSQLEIERLERELEKIREKSSPPREVVLLPPSCASRSQRKEEEWYEDEMSERLRPERRSERSFRRTQTEFDWRLKKFDEAQIITKEGQNAVLEEEKPKQELEIEKAAVQEWKPEQAHIKRKEGGAADTAAPIAPEVTTSPKGILKPRRESFSEGPNPVSEGVAPLEKVHTKDISPDNLWTEFDPFVEGLSLPGNLEDLLGQWTTLNKQEIQRGQLSAF
ncbi:uncharacterized protein N7482_005594 [Penicillium canariense]|uniref:Fungal N-terminal domain-containing protein n=1 Tax=Penicillium canariense TaxID=189055 RepID=A0A9W9I4X5_9EURO|nr:uncharacterized protein N7482_005594 [Penicillium canariense]KAJ5166813.1 hypothetical protein N7482_005594 [Penicillium canariense]